MKKHGKKRLLVAAVCLALGAAAARTVWANAVPQHTPGGTNFQEHSEEQEETRQTESVVCDSAFWVELVQNTVQDAFPLTELSAEIMDAKEIRLTGTLQKETAEKLLEGQDDEISQAYAAIMEYLPQELPVSCRLEVRAEGGGAALTCRQLTAASMELPDTLLEEGLLEPLERGLNDELEKKLQYVTDVQSEDGSLTISGWAS